MRTSRVSIDMARKVVEVVVRFGDTVLHVGHVAADEEYRIGTAPGVDLAVPGYTSFPLVANGAIRCPVGVIAHEHGNETELCFALVTIRLRHVELHAGPLARPRAGTRMPAFALASLLVHLGIWLCAVVLEPLERLEDNARPRLRHAHVTDMPDPPPDSPPKARRATQAQVPAPAATMAPARRDRGRRVDTDLPATAAAAAARLAAAVANTHVVERVSALRPEDTYVEDDDNAKGFGGSPRFAPPGETIKTGDGYKLMLYDVRLCATKACTVSGPVPASFVRAALHDHMDAIYDCYREHAAAPGTIVLEFTIAGDGSVRDARGSGLGETGACVARVLPEIYFKAIGDIDVPEGKPKITTVRYPVEFR